MSNPDIKPSKGGKPSPGQYDRVLKRLTMELEDAELKSWDYMQQKVEEAVELELTAEEMARDELDLLGAYLMRDLKKLGFYAHRTGAGVAAWLKFDLDILEERTLRMLLDIADKTRIEQELLREKLSHDDSSYVAGELATAGTLKCLQCGQSVMLKSTSVIQPCHQCQNHTFERMSESI